MENLTENTEETAELEPQTETAPAEAKKNGVGQAIKSYFTATRIAYLALFTALAYLLYMPIFEFWIIPAVPFLKVDFSNTFVMIAGFALGPVAGVIAGALKEFLHALTFSQTVGVGELANILIMLPYVLIPSIIYKKHKGLKVVLISLTIGCVSQALWSIPVNYLLTFPFFLTRSGATWQSGMEFYLTVWYWAVLFNLVKTVLITVAVVLLYKPLSRLIKMTNEKFQKRKQDKQ